MTYTANFLYKAATRIVAESVVTSQFPLVCWRNGMLYMVQLPIRQPVEGGTVDYLPVCDIDDLRAG